MTAETLPAILDALSEAVLVIDSNRRILLANNVARGAFGEDLVGQNFVRAVRHPECLQCIDDVLSGQRASRIEVPMSTPVQAIYRVNVVGLDAAHASDPRAVISISDISHIHEAEQMRSDFVANVSHELRSPLTALNGIIETLKGPAKDDANARLRFLDVMEREAQRMDRLIGDLLSLSKVETKRRIRPAGKTDIPATIERVITTLSLQAEREGKPVKLVKPEGQCSVLGDNDELTQVFQNLIENAIRYSGPGSPIVVTIEKIENAVGVHGQALSVEVRDEGPGIAPIHLPRLTERFYRVDDSRSRENGGTGLGLAIVKHIVNRHRGRLQIKSKVGTGSTFTVLLPLIENSK